MLLVPSSSNNHQLLVFSVKDKKFSTKLNDVGRIAALQSDGEILIDQYVPNGISYLIYKRINNEFMASYQISLANDVAGNCKFKDVKKIGQ